MIINVLYSVFGLVIFLQGLTFMSESLQDISGPKLKEAIKLLTSNRWVGAVLGFIITLILQSSTATTVTIVSFVDAGLMTLTEAIGVIMGANIGTTVSSLIFTLDLHNINTFLILIGIFLILFAKQKGGSSFGQIVLGFGCLFLGIQIMTNGMAPIASEPIIANLFDYTYNPLIGLLFGMIITALLQSSSALTGLLLAMAGSGVISGLDQVIFIVYGQAIGTCFTAVFVGFRGTKNAKRASLIHLLFNIIGTFVFTILTLLPLGYIDFLMGLSLDLKMQILYSQIFFNIIMTLILLPMSSKLLKLTKILVK